MIEADDPGFYNEDEPEDSSWACKGCHRIMAVPPEVSRLCGKCKDLVSMLADRLAAEIDAAIFEKTYADVLRRTVQDAPGRAQ